MKKILLATTMIASMGVNAESDDKYVLCEVTASLAAEIMDARQAGVTMAKIMSVLQDGLKSTLEPLVIEAYKKPLFNTAAHKERASTEFQNSAFLSCIEAYKKG